MKYSIHIYRGLLLAGVAAAALAAPTFAADTKADPRDARINALEQKLDALIGELKTLKQEQAEDNADKEALQNQVIDLKRAQNASYADVQAQRSGDVKVSLANARPTFTTADGAFSLSIRSLLQYDAAYYSQDNRAASGTDLSSGSVFRRARIGLQGKAFGDWSYSFLYDFGGSGIEGPGLSDAYIQYDRIPWLKIRTGAFPTPGGIEDQTSAGDLIFLERAAPTDLARSIGGSDGRKNFLGLISYGNDYYASLAWTGARAFDPVSFDSQQALVGRAAYRVYKNADTNVVLSGTGTYVFRLPQTAVGNNSASPINLQVRPENVVDGTRLISTGNIDTNKFSVWGVEAAANWKNLYAQAGYFGYHADRRTGTLPNPTFDGWYAQATWVLTGEPRRYNTETATWQSPRAAKPFSLKNGDLGAWELAARYSKLDLNFNEGLVGFNTLATAGAIRGGKEEGYTVGINWYPNSAIRFLFDYQHEEVDRIGTTAPFRQIGQNVDILTARAQLSF